VIQTPTQELVLGLTGSRQESESSIRGMGFPLSPGADDEGRLRVSALRFFQEWTARGEREVLAARSELSLGVDAFDATTNNNAPDSQFLAWRFQGQWVRLLSPDTLLLLRIDGQLANQALLSLEQFRLGGFDSVRGYRQDQLLGDNGVFASAEVRVPIVRVPQWEAILQLTPFVDVGTLWNSDEDNGERPELDPNSLASLGLGLRWQLGNSLTARFDWGIPLIDVDAGDKTLQEQGLYFSVIYSPF
jgi:hemolysin activation/secretion protein